MPWSSGKVIALGVVWLGLGLLTPLSAQEPKLKTTLVKPTYLITSLAFSPSGKTLVSGSMDNAIKLWDLGNGTEKATLTGHRGVWSVAFSPEGKTLASGSADKTIKLWDVESKKERSTLV